MPRLSSHVRAALTTAVLLTIAAPGAASAAPAVRTIVIDKMKFGPAPAGLKAGDVILWVNKDMFRHTATAGDKSFDIDLPAGASGKTRLTHAGTIAFVCKYHPGMKGQLTVGK